MADMDRYIQRMEQYELEKNSSRAGGQESFVEAEQGQLQSRLTSLWCRGMERGLTEGSLNLSLSSKLVPSHG